MVDLMVGENEIAIEVTGAMDEEWISRWNAIRRQGAAQFNVEGDWAVEIQAGAKIKQLRRPLEGFLRGEVAGSVLRDLGITHVWCLREVGSGKVIFTMAPLGGAAHDEAEGLTEWLASFLRSHDLADVRTKLSASGALSKEIFVQVEMSVPWCAWSYLTGECLVLPREVPELPTPIDGVWLSAQGRVLAWRDQVWQWVRSTPLWLPFNR